MQLQEIKKPRQLFAEYLEAELSARKLNPADLTRRTWSHEAREAVKAAMSKSPILFGVCTVSRWFNLSDAGLRAKLMI
jgi:hypothetical protein